MTPKVAASSSWRFFGWRIVFAVSLCAAAVIGVAFSSFIMFSAPFGEEFGWTEAQTGALVSAMWLTGPLVLAVGPFVDKLGPWRLLVSGVVVQALAVATTPFVQNYEQMVSLRIVMGIGLVLQTSAGPVLVARWFQRRFSFAMAITWSAAAGGQIIMAPLTVYLDEAFGWRAAAVVLAGLIVVALAIAILISRCAAYPAHVGQTVDGQAPAEELTPQPSAITAGWTATLAAINWQSALVMCLAVFAAGAATVAFQAGAPAFFSALGLSQAAAAIMISVFAATALFGSIIAGWVLDRYTTTITALLVAASVYAGLVALFSTLGVTGLLFAVLAAGLLGYGLGAGEVLWITLFKRQFGTAAFATTYGLFFCSFQLGMAFGGFAGGYAIEQLGLVGFVLSLGGAYLAPVAFSLWRPGKMAPLERPAS